jgi:glyceraldehyde 3-phosphate dehydrogenase
MKRLVVGLNGFGRIGRCIYRLARLTDAFSVSIINELNPDAGNLAYLLKNDSTYGRYTGQVGADKTSITVDGTRIPVTHERKITSVPWAKHECDLVIDSTGSNNTLDEAISEDVGTKHVLFTNAPSRSEVKPVVFGVNEADFDPKRHRVICSTFCDSVAFGPIATLLDATMGMVNGFITTLHPWLIDQNLVDGPYTIWADRGELDSNWAMGRAAPGNLIPKVTSLCRATGLVVPWVPQRMQAMSFRTPTNIVTSGVLVFNAGRDTTRQEIVDLFVEAERKQKVHVFKNNTDEALISGDYRGEDYSAIIDHRFTQVLEKRVVRMMYWYDNEWGYSARVVDLVKLIAERS